MTPSELNIPIFRGSRWTFRFYVEESEAPHDPVDLTGLGPFVCEVKDLRTDRILAVAEVTSNYDDEGWFEITLTPEQTITFQLGHVRMGVRDANSNPFMEGTPEVRWFTPTPTT
jgi:hypothetical protein